MKMFYKISLWLALLGGIYIVDATLPPSILSRKKFNNDPSLFKRLVVGKKGSRVSF